MTVGGQEGFSGLAVLWSDIDLRFALDTVELKSVEQLWFLFFYCL